MTSNSSSFFYNGKIDIESRLMIYTLMRDVRSGATD